MKKQNTGRYTMNAGKAIKGSRVIMCQVDDDGAAYVCNGHVLYRMTREEYAATVQGVVNMEPGNWKLVNGEKVDMPDSVNLTKYLVDADAETCKVKGETLLTRCPLELPDGKRTISSYYSNAGFAVFFNQLYVSAFGPDCVPHGTGCNSPAVFYTGDHGCKVVGMVLPIKPDDKAYRAVKAYFTESDTDGLAAEQRDTARAELYAVRAELDTTRAELEAARAELETLKTQAAAKPEPETEPEPEHKPEPETEHKPEPETEPEHKPEPEPEHKPETPKAAAEAICARFARFAGVRPYIKGAQTTAPVVWLDGDTEAHADELKAAGAKWSGKRGAYYVRVA